MFRKIFQNFVFVVYRRFIAVFIADTLIYRRFLGFIATLIAVFLIRRTVKVHTKHIANFKELWPISQSPGFTNCPKVTSRLLGNLVGNLPSKVSLFLDFRFLGHFISPSWSYFTSSIHIRLTGIRASAFPVFCNFPIPQLIRTYPLNRTAFF